jgi:integrase
MKHDFTLFRRENSKIWYFYFRIGNKRISRTTKKTKKQDAEIVANKFVKEHDVRSDKKITVGEYAEKFFDYDTSPYIKRRIKRKKKKKISRGTAIFRQRQLENYILPKWGNTPLNEIDPVTFEDWLDSLDLGGQTKNHLLYTMNLVYKEAKRQGIIDRIPIADAETYEEKPRRADIFSEDELRKLFLEKPLEIWGDRKTLCFFGTLAATGARLSEIRALKWKDYFFHKVAWAILIDKAEKDYEDTGPTKTGEPRAAWIPDWLSLHINSWRNETLTLKSEDLIFWGSFPGEPWSRSWCGKLFKNAMAKVKIEQNERLLQIRSFRRTFNTRMRGEMTGDTLRAVMGHRTESMTNLYDAPETELLLDRIEDARPAIENIWKK